MTPFAVFLAVAFLTATVILWSRYRRLARERFIRDYAFPRGLYERLRKRRPELELRDCALVARALRQFFLAYLRSGRGFVSMPSQVADDLWHEFILYTKAYDAFCRAAFGGFLHHTPAVVLSTDRQNNAGLRRVWWHACKEENIDPAKPSRLPLLFAIDTKFAIADGFRYTPNCHPTRATGVEGSVSANIHCGGDFSDTGIDGCTDGFGDGSSSSGGDGGDGGGGCGGGD